MKLDYEDGILRIENARGLRWQLTNASKPDLSFPFDALTLSDQHALRRFEGRVLPLAETEIQELRQFITTLTPPPGVTVQRQLVVDLRAFAHGLINTLVTQLEYDGLLDVAITAREGSTDLYAEEARRVLTYVDSVWNAYYGLTAKIAATPEAELKSVKEYAEMMPFPPAMEHFSNAVPEGLFYAAPNKS